MLTMADQHERGGANVHDDNTGSCKVDSHAAGFCGKQKDRNRLILCELVDQRLADINRSRSRKNEELNLALIEHFLQNVQDLGKLRPKTRLGQFTLTGEDHTPGRISRRAGRSSGSSKGALATP